MQKVIDANPHNASALNFLGYTYAEQNKNLDEAEILVRKAIEVKPNDGYITDSLGWVLFQQGRIAEALKTLEKADRLAPDEPVILEHLGDAYLKNAEKQKALEVYQRALESDREEDEEIKDRLRKKIEQLQQELTSIRDYFGSPARFQAVLAAVSKQI